MIITIIWMDHIFGWLDPIFGWFDLHKTTFWILLDLFGDFTYLHIVTCLLVKMHDDMMSVPETVDHWIMMPGMTFISFGGMALSSRSCHTFEN
jgi:thiosulfate reductase cytochrome b subunit